MLGTLQRQHGHDPGKRAVVAAAFWGSRARAHHINTGDARWEAVIAAHKTASSMSSRLACCTHVSLAGSGDCQPTRFLLTAPPSLAACNHPPAVCVITDGRQRGLDRCPHQGADQAWWPPHAALPRGQDCRGEWQGCRCCPAVADQRQGQDPQQQ